MNKRKDNPHRLLQCSCTSSISYWVNTDDALPIGSHSITTNSKKQKLPINQLPKQARTHNSKTKITGNIQKNPGLFGCRETLTKKKKKETKNSIQISKLTLIIKTQKVLHSTKANKTMWLSLAWFIQFLWNNTAKNKGINMGIFVLSWIF